MNKIRLLGVLFALLISPTFAYVSGKVAINEKPIYCPREITCTAKGNFSSCTYRTETPQYWGGGYDAGGVGGIVYEGTYKLSRVRSNYHNNVMNTDCHYAISNPKAGEPVNAALMLLVKRGVFLEANYAKGSQWADYGMNGINCYSDNTMSCPLNVASGLGVVYDRIDVKKYSINTSIPPIWIDGRRVFLSYDKATSCWSTKLCKIDFEITSNDTGKVALGSVIVDMDNRMKIVEIQSIKTSGFDIKKMELLNTVEISQLCVPSASSLEIDNLLNFDIAIMVNAAPITIVPKKEHGNVFSYRIVEACLNVRACTIDLKAGAGVIGSVIVDIENNMNIMFVQTKRSSAIRVNEVDSHRVEVSYHSLNGKDF